MTSVRLRPVQWPSKSVVSRVHLLDVDDWYDDYDGVAKAICGTRNPSGEFVDEIYEEVGLCQRCLVSLHPILRNGSHYELEDGRPLFRFDPKTSEAVLVEGPYGPRLFVVPEVKATGPRLRPSALALAEVLSQPRRIAVS